jgi:hypothetical protein
MLTGQDFPPSVFQAIQKLPQTKRVPCKHCHFETYIPILWDCWWCERCGEKNSLDLSGLVYGVVRESLLWAHMDPDVIGLSMGDPKRISPRLTEHITKTFGRPLPFMSLRQHFNWECQHSGKCCSDVVKYTCESSGRLSPQESVSLCGRPDQSYLPRKATEDPMCAYRVNNRCSAYHVRPSFCRTYPLGVLSIEVGDKRVHYIVASGVCCPGLGKGRTWRVKDYLKEVGVLQRLTASNTDGYTQRY